MPIARTSFRGLLLACTFLTGGCLTRGPSSIAEQRGPYTEVLSATDKEELLANIVRLAYFDAPVFLQVSSVTASPTFEYGGEVDIGLGDGGRPSPLVLAKPKLLAKDSPTIVYKPLLGKEFAGELLMPFDIRPVFLMLDNGFDFSIVAQLLFKSMNNLSNSRTATSAEREAFRRVTDVMGRLLHKGDVQVGTTTEGLGAAGGRVLVTLRSEAALEGDGAFVLKELGLDPKLASFELKSGLVGDAGSIAVATRSLLALLSYMSNYVEVPAEHAAMVAPSDALRDPHPLMRVHSSAQQPDRGDPAVFYKGYWFYIAADDLRSRNTLFLIRLLFNLQAQSSVGEPVQLTLPVR